MSGGIGAVLCDERDMIVMTDEIVTGEDGEVARERRPQQTCGVTFVQARELRVRTRTQAQFDRTKAVAWRRTTHTSATRAGMRTMEGLGGGITNGTDGDMVEATAESVTADIGHVTGWECRTHGHALLQGIVLRILAHTIVLHGLAVQSACRIAGAAIGSRVRTIEGGGGGVF